MRTQPDTALEYACWGTCVGGRGWDERRDLGPQAKPQEAHSSQGELALRPPPCPTRRQRAGGSRLCQECSCGSAGRGTGQPAARRAGGRVLPGCAGGLSSGLTRSPGDPRPGRHGPGSRDLFRGSPRPGVGTARPRARRGTNGVGVGVRGAPRGRQLCVSSSAHHPTRAQATVPSNAHPSPRRTAPGQLSGPRRRGRASSPRDGRREENSTPVAAGSDSRSILESQKVASQRL